ncbi:hypothetical protein T190115A13A_10275 [Tenacibaculum sp. 190524A02b]|uniref:Uncharacterized protein n=1 Tax=Tenacibaculum vairaonense TaxID=3137860 RepID=A0ABM9PKE1_9FLAO
MLCFSNNIFIHNSLLANEITQALSEGHEIQKQGTAPFFIFPN